MFPFDHIIHLRNVDHFVKSAQHMWKTLVHFQDHDVRLLQDGPGDARSHGQVKISVAVHRSNACHGDVDRQEMAVIGSQVPEDHRNEVAEPPVAELALIVGAVPAVIDKVLPLRIALHCFQPVEYKIASDLHVEKFILTLRQCRLQQDRKDNIGGKVHPVAAFYNFDSFFGCAELPAVFIVIIHGSGASGFRNQVPPAGSVCLQFCFQYKIKTGESHEGV